MVIFPLPTHLDKKILAHIFLLNENPFEKGESHFIFILKAK